MTSDQALAYLISVGVGDDPSMREAVASGRMSDEEFITRTQRRAAPTASAAGGWTEPAAGWDRVTAPHAAEVPVSLEEMRISIAAQLGELNINTPNFWSNTTIPGAERNTAWGVSFNGYPSASSPQVIAATNGSGVTASAYPAHDLREPLASVTSGFMPDYTNEGPFRQVYDEGKAGGAFGGLSPAMLIALAALAFFLLKGR